MKRISFNGGELSPESAMRVDLDVFHRGASCIENFDVSQMGGIKRRRGMRLFSPALSGSRIFPYIYSNEDRYPEFNNEVQHMRGTEGKEA